MSQRRRVKLVGGALLLCSTVLAACAENAPQDTLDPAGPYAERIDSLFRPVFWIAVAVFVLVEGLLVYILVRFRHRPGRGIPPQIHGSKRMEVAWTIAPALLLAVIAGPTVGAVFQLERRPEGPTVMDIRVVGHQWWWEVEYSDLDVLTANEIHIPVDTPVRVAIESVDVIHSFWVPRLAGKQDMVPGRVTELNVEASEPGRYEGQCAEFCGLSHANMLFVVIAEPRADFDRWVQAQRQESPPPPQEILSILTNPDYACGGCHIIGGVENAVGRIGPTLNHFGSRSTFAGSILSNTPENLRRWLDDPPELKPGADMPDLGLTREEIDALVAYLEGLE